MSERPRIDVEASRIRCPWCHDSVAPRATDWVACAGCLARHHGPCWKESGKCATCAHEEAVLRPRPSHALPWVAVAALLVVTAGVGVFAGRLVRPATPSPFPPRKVEFIEAKELPFAPVDLPREKPSPEKPVAKPLVENVESAAKPPPKTEASVDLVPVATFTLRSTVPAIFIAPDSSWAWFLDSSEGRVHRIDLGRRSLDTRTVLLADGAEGMCASPDGRTLYLHGARGTDAAGGRAGRIETIDTAAFEVASSFPLEGDPAAIAVTNRHVFVAGRATLLAVDPAKQAVVGKLGVGWSTAHARITSDGRRLYLGSSNVSPSSIECVVVGEDRTKLGPHFAAPYQNDVYLDGRFELSPDDRYLVSASGAVLRLAKSQVDDLKFVAKVPPHRASAFDVAGGKLYLAVDDALEVWSYPDLEKRVSWRLGTRIYRMAFSPSSGLLVAAVDPRLTGPPSGSRATGVGDVCVFDLSQKK